MTKRTRLRISIAAAIILSSLAFISVFKGFESVAMSCIAGILTILSTYIWGETTRPSKEDEQ